MYIIDTSILIYLFELKFSDTDKNYAPEYLKESTAKKIIETITNLDPNEILITSYILAETESVLRNPVLRRMLSYTNNIYKNEELLGYISNYLNHISNSYSFLETNQTKLMKKAKSLYFRESNYIENSLFDNLILADAFLNNLRIITVDKNLGEFAKNESIQCIPKF